MSTIRTDEREALRSHLSGGGVQWRVYHDPPIHLQRAYAALAVTLPTAAAPNERVLSRLVRHCPE